MQEAQRNILDASRELAGSVTLGLAPWSTASLIGPAILRAVRTQYPGILLHISDMFGFTYSELTLRGHMDLAVLYGDSPPRGLLYRLVGTETFCLVAKPELVGDVGVTCCRAAADLPTVLPAPARRACRAAPAVGVAEVYATRVGGAGRRHRRDGAAARLRRSLPAPKI